MKKLALNISMLLMAGLLMPACEPFRFADAKSISIDGGPYALSAFDLNPHNQITKVVIFGDSLSDTNNLKSNLQIATFQPFFWGRFSNGPVWNDYLANLAHVRIENNSQGGAVTKADLSADMSEIMSTDVNGLISFFREVGRYIAIGSIEEFVDEYLKINDDHINEPDKTLFIIWAGANDYLRKFNSSEELTNLIDNPDVPKKGGNAIADMSSDNIVNEVVKLYKAGARHILVGNLPDIGVTPAIRSDKNYKFGTTSEDERRYHLSQELSRITALHNKLLKEKIAKVKGKLMDNASQIILFDAAKALNNLMNNIGPKGELDFDYGIDNANSFGELTIPGKKPLKIGKKCYFGDPSGSKESMICNNASKMLFWDEIHPTSAGHCRIAFLMHTLLYEAGLVATKADFDQYKKTCQ